MEKIGMITRLSTLACSSATRLATEAGRLLKMGAVSVKEKMLAIWMFLVSVVLLAPVGLSGTAAASQHGSGDVKTAEGFFESFLTSDMGRIIVRISQFFGMLVLVVSLINIVRGALRPQGERGIGSIIVKFLPPLLLAVLLFNLVLFAQFADVLVDVLEAILKFLPWFESGTESGSS